MITDQVKNTTNKGRLGEDLAIRYLERKKYKLLCRNYYIRGGEIDLVMGKNGIIRFVEVKLRTGKKFGTAEESITSNKKQKLLRAIFSFLHDHPGSGRWQLDLVAIHLDTHTRTAFIQHFPNFLEA